MIGSKIDRGLNLNTSTSHIDRYFMRNTIGISAVELFWGLGLPVVMESTFLQLFLRHLGTSSFLIGLIPTLFFIGISLFSLFSGFFTANLEHKKTAVIILHLFASLPMLLFGIFLHFTGFTPDTLQFFFIVYTFFSIGIGLILPTWQNYLVKIYSEDKIISGHSIMWIFQSIGKFLSGFVILKIITRYSFSAEGVSLIFSIVGIVFITGSLLFLLTKESTPYGPKGIPILPESSREQTNKKMFFMAKLHKFTSDALIALHNRNFLLLLASDFELYALISIMAFYANYATEFCGIQLSTAAGVFVILSYSGMISINILFGRTKFLSLKSKYMTAKIISLITALILFLFTSLWAFLIASFLMGVSRGTRSLVYMPSVKKISGVKDATNFFSVAPLLVMPVSTGLPLLSGAFLDHFTRLGGNSYRLMFLGLVFLIILGIFFLSKVHIDETVTTAKR